MTLVALCWTCFAISLPFLHRGP